MINVRKLAAIDIAFLGPRIIIPEFGLGVVGPLGLGILSFIRGHSVWEFVLGGYLLMLALNYVPLFLYAVSIVRRGSAAEEIAGELVDQAGAFRKYRRQSLLLLAPLVVPLLAIVQEREKSKSKTG